MIGRTMRIAASALVAGLVVGGCGGEPSPAPTTTVQPQVEASPKAGPPTPDVPKVWPLTGVETKQVAKRPALSIKVENSSSSRPQAGLTHADIVWEEVVEGGITRFVAVYHSRLPDTVEPVRSVRPMDPAIVAPLDGILAYSGAQGAFIDAVEAAGTQSVIMDRGDPGFSRDPNRAAPHNVVGAPETFLAQADGERTAPPRQQFRFADEVGKGTTTVSGKKARTLDVKLSTAQRSVWDWDKDSRTWLRSEGSSRSVSTSGERHAARNVVVLSVKVVNTQFRDASGAPVPETQLVGSGSGVVASGGRVIDVKWSKKGLHKPVVLTAGGKPVELDPGNTWVELVPRGTGRWSTS